MSRYEVYHKDKGLAFGSDHACGVYLQIWQRPDSPNERSLQDRVGPNPEDMLVDEDTLTGLTSDKKLEIIEQHGFTLFELEASIIATVLPDYQIEAKDNMF